MLMYGKIVGDCLIQATSRIRLGDRLIINPTASQYAEAGYYPVEVTECEEREGYYATPVYTKKRNKIVQSWEYTEIVTEPEPEIEEGNADRN